MPEIRIHVLVIDHEHGQNITVHPTDEDARKTLYEYVEENWDLGDFIPDDEGEAIDKYFEDAAGRGFGHSESYSLEETTVKIKEELTK